MTVMLDELDLRYSERTCSSRGVAVEVAMSGKESQFPKKPDAIPQ